MFNLQRSGEIYYHYKFAVNYKHEDDHMYWVVTIENVDKRLCA